MKPLRMTVSIAFASVALLRAAGALAAIQPDQPNAITFPATEARFVRFWIHESSQGQPCIDELEVYGPGSDVNLALASTGAKATASSCLPGYAIHQVVHLNDGLYGNSHSWIAAGDAEEWAQIELPKPAQIAKVVFSRDREGKFKDHVPVSFEVQLSVDGQTWRKVAEAGARPLTTRVKPLPASGPVPEEDLLRYAFACEERSWFKVRGPDSITRVLEQMQELVDRLAAKGLDVSKERAELAALRQRDRAAEEEVFYAARLAKRRLLLRDPDLAPLQKILFVARQPFRPSHNYSELLDAQGAPGGAVCVWKFRATMGAWMSVRQNSRSFSIPAMAWPAMPWPTSMRIESISRISRRKAIISI